MNTMNKIKLLMKGMMEPPENPQEKDSGFSDIRIFQRGHNEIKNGRMLLVAGNPERDIKSFGTPNKSHSFCQSDTYTRNKGFVLFIGAKKYNFGKPFNALNRISELDVLDYFGGWSLIVSGNADKQGLMICGSNRENSLDECSKIRGGGQALTRSAVRSFVRQAVRITSALRRLDLIGLHSLMDGVCFIRQDRHRKSNNGTSMVYRSPNLSALRSNCRCFRSGYYKAIFLAIFNMPWGAQCRKIGAFFAARRNTNAEFCKASRKWASKSSLPKFGLRILSEQVADFYRTISASRTGSTGFKRTFHTQRLFISTSLFYRVMEGWPNSHHTCFWFSDRQRCVSPLIQRFHSTLSTALWARPSVHSVGLSIARYNHQLGDRRALDCVARHPADQKTISRRGPSFHHFPYTKRVMQ